MKNLINVILAFSMAIVVFSCRKSDEIPQDTHEHEEIEKVTVTLTDKTNASSVQTINYIGGTADKKITLENGKTYTVKLDFFTKHNNAYENMYDELVKEKDEHFITYQFAGVNVNVIRTSEDVIRTDGKKVGIRTEWAVTNAPSAANVNIKLIHAATSVSDNSPSATNQLGLTTGGEADVNALLSIQ